MAANDYLKAAAAQLRRAAVYMQRQAHDFIAELDRMTSQKSKEITQHQVNMKLKQAELSSNNNGTDRSELEREVHTLQKQIETKKNEVKQATNDLNNAARSKQQAAQEIESKARELEQKAGLPDFSN